VQVPSLSLVKSISSPFRCSANFSPSAESHPLSAFPCRFPSSIHPSILSTTSSSSSQRCLTRTFLLCQVFGLVLVVLFSDSRSSINPFSSSSLSIRLFFCSLGEYVSRPLLRENYFFIFAFLWVCYDLPAIEYAAMPLLQKKPLIDFVYALSVFDLVSIPRSRNQLFPQSYDSCFQFRSVPSPLPFFSVVSTLYSSRYLPPRLLYNIVDTL